MIYEQRRLGPFPLSRKKPLTEAIDLLDKKEPSALIAEAQDQDTLTITIVKDKTDNNKDKVISLRRRYITRARYRRENSWRHPRILWEKST